MYLSGIFYFQGFDTLIKMGVDKYTCFMQTYIYYCSKPKQWQKYGPEYSPEYPQRYSMLKQVQQATADEHVDLSETFLSNTNTL